MSAHALLVAHNLSVLDAMFASVRSVLLADGSEIFNQHVERFTQVYDGDLGIFKEAAVVWKDVDLARGKGRLAREKVQEPISVLNDSGTSL
jgi:queuine tRNA-ribosyltransferase